MFFAFLSVSSSLMVVQPGVDIHGLNIFEHLPFLLKITPSISPPFYFFISLSPRRNVNSILQAFILRAEQLHSWILRGKSFQITI